MLVGLTERPTPALLALAAALVAALGTAAAALLAAGPGEAFLLLAVSAVAVSAVVLLPWVDPAIPLTLGLLASVLSGSWDFVGIPFGLDRPLLAYGLAGVALRLLPDARRPARIASPRLRRLHWLLAAVALYAIGSATFAGTLLEREPLFALMDRLGLIGFGLFAVAPVAFATARRRDWLLAGLLVLGAYLSLTAVFETVGLRSLVFPRYINDPALGIHFDRARGPFLEAAANGLALYACLVAAAIGATVWRRPAVRAACVAIALACLLGLLLTLTRQVWIGAVLSTVAVALTAPALRRLLIPALVLGGVGVVVAFAVVPGLQDRAEVRAESRTPVWDRLNSNRAALAMVDDRPLLGFGWYRFGADSPPYYEQASDYPLTAVPRAHNVFLGHAVELGLVGTLLWAAALGGVLVTAIAGRAPPDLEPWRLGLIAVAVNWLVVANFTPLSYAFANHLLWLLAGVVCARHLRPSAARGV